MLLFNLIHISRISDCTGQPFLPLCLYTSAEKRPIISIKQAVVDNTHKLCAVETMSLVKTKPWTGRSLSLHWSSKVPSQGFTDRWEAGCNGGTVGPNRKMAKRLPWVILTKVPLSQGLWTCAGRTWSWHCSAAKLIISGKSCSNCPSAGRGVVDESMDRSSLAGNSSGLAERLCSWDRVSGRTGEGEVCWGGRFVQVLAARLSAYCLQCRRYASIFKGVSVPDTSRLVRKGHFAAAILLHHWSLISPSPKRHARPSHDITYLHHVSQIHVTLCFCFLSFDQLPSVSFANACFSTINTSLAVGFC